MIFTGERKVPALLRAKVSADDSVSLTLTRGMKTGYMVKGEFDSELGNVTAKIFPTESVARSYSQGQEIIKVDITWVP